MIDANEYATCTTNSTTLLAVTAVFENYWSANSFQAAGVVGFGFNNPAIKEMLHYPYSGYTLQLSNFTDLTFAQNDFTPARAQGFLALSASAPATQDVMILPYPQDKSFLRTTEFGFGQKYSNGTAFYHSILNTKDMSTSEPGFYVNSTVLTTQISGLGLPRQSYNSFINLIGIATSGQLSCANQDLSGCYLPSSCSAYPDLWLYSFKIGF